jgi:hypothetical protein
MTPILLVHPSMAMREHSCLFSSVDYDQRVEHHAAVRIWYDTCSSASGSHLTRCCRPQIAWTMNSINHCVPSESFTLSSAVRRRQMSSRYERKISTGTGRHTTSTGSNLVRLRSTVTASLESRSNDAVAVLDSRFVVEVGDVSYHSALSIRRPRPCPTG